MRSISIWDLKRMQTHNLQLSSHFLYLQTFTRAHCLWPSLPKAWIPGQATTAAGILTAGTAKSSSQWSFRLAMTGRWHPLKQPNLQSGRIGNGMNMQFTTEVTTAFWQQPSKRQQQARIRWSTSDPQHEHPHIRKGYESLHPFSLPLSATARNSLHL